MLGDLLKRASKLQNQHWKRCITHIEIVALTALETCKTRVHLLQKKHWSIISSHDTAI